VVAVNVDQNVFTYDIVTKGKKQKLSLQKVSSRCLYLDEIIDVRYLINAQHKSPRFAILASNNEHLKLIDLETGEIEIYVGQGHSNIILSLDVVAQDDHFLVLTASKDNEIRMW
jgi:WD40 repeat protein